MVFEDTSIRGSIGAPPAPPRVQARALSSMNHRPRRLGGPIAVAAVVLVLLVVVVLIGAHSDHPGHSTTTTAPTTTPATPTTASPAGGHATTTTPAGGHAATTTPAGGHAAATTPAGGKHGKPTPTTAPALPTKFTPVTSTATTATYALPAASYTITFTTAGGECWINVATPGGGTTVYSETLAAGASHAVTATGQTTVTLGAPSVVSITVDHEPVVLPAGYQTPFTLTFQPPAG